MNTIKKGIVILLMIFIIFGICSILFIKINNIRVFTLVSNSMQPTLKEGSLLFNKIETFKDINTGDIITYKIKNSNINVTHRVNEIDQINKRILCKGDANKDVDDSFIGYEQYLGTLKFYLPYLGDMLLFLNSTIGKVISSIILVSLLISLIYDLYKKKKNVL